MRHNVRMLAAMASLVVNAIVIRPELKVTEPKLMTRPKGSDVHRKATSVLHRTAHGRSWLLTYTFIFGGEHA